MEVDVQLPSNTAQAFDKVKTLLSPDEEKKIILDVNTAQIFEEVTKCLSPDEEKKIILNVKKRFPGKLDQLSDDNFPDLLQGLFKLGDITEEDLSLLSLITAKAEKKNDIQAAINKHQPQEVGKFVGREKDVEIVRNILTMVKPRVRPGVNLYGESGVGKTTLAQEVAKVLVKHHDFKVITIDLRGIFEIEHVYFRFLEEINLKAFDKDVGRLFSHLKSMDEKTLLILDSVEQLISKDAGDARAPFIEFLCKIAASQACSNGSLKLLLTSREQLKDKPLSRKMFSERKVEPFDKVVSKNFLRPTELKEAPGFSMEDENANLLKIAGLCNNMPYLLKAAKRMLREDLRMASQILERLDTQSKRYEVPDEYVCIAEQFDTIPNDNLKELAVKLSLLQQPFSVSTAMKIADISSEYDATIDLGLLLGREVISLHKEEGDGKADEGKREYYIHAKFHEFVQEYLCKKQEHFKEIYKEGQKQFFIHFSDELSKLSYLMESEFVEFYKQLEKNRANFEHVIDISKSRSDVLDILLHSDQHSEAASFGILFEAFKDRNERKKLYSRWAEIAEISGNWLASAQLRCWQAMQGDYGDANRVLRIAEESLEKAREQQQELKQLQQEQQQLLQQQQHIQQQHQLEFANSLYHHARGWMKWLYASKSKLGEKEKRDLIKKGIKDLKEAIRLSGIKERNGEASTMVARIINLIGNCYMDLNDPDSAEGFYLRALEMKRKLVGSEGSYDRALDMKKELVEDEIIHWEIPTYYNQIAQVHERRGRNMEGKCGPFFNKSKITSEYLLAVNWMEKAIDLQKELGLSDTEHTATFQRNLANSLIGLKRYDEALKYANSCCENREQRLGNHPDTVKILYLTGIIHEWRKDVDKACETYKKAFEMEEELPEYNHSDVRSDIRDRLKEMYKKLESEEELRQFEMRIEKMKNDIPGPAEVFITVTQHGGICNRSAEGFLLHFPRECVSKATRICCEAFSSRSDLPSPNDSTESLVSHIVELGPHYIKLDKHFYMTLLHCGVSESKGYETKVKVFNKELKVWEEVEELSKALPLPENTPSPFIQVKLRKMSTVAVVSRLITTTFEVPIKDDFVRSKVFSEVIVTFPKGAIDETIKGGLQVIPIPDHMDKDSKSKPLPVLLFSGFNKVVFKKHVHITVPCLYPESKYGPRVLRLVDATTPSFSWKDITDRCKTVRGKNCITMKVEELCGLWIWMNVRSGLNRRELGYLKNLANDLYKYLHHSPFYVSLAAYQKAGTTSNKSKLDLKLTCVANHKQHDLTRKLKKEDYLFLKSATPDEPMRKGEKAFPDFEGDENFRVDLKDPLEFLGIEGGYYEKTLALKTKLTDFKLSFYRDEEKKTSLCKLHLKKKEFENRDGPDSSNAYIMKSLPRGLMIVIDNRKVVVNPSDRTGSEEDVDQLNSLFARYLLFEVHILKTAKKEGEQLLDDLRGMLNKPEYKAVDCFALCIMGHGQGSELCYDGSTIEMSKIFNLFSDYRGKPKLFFIQGFLLEDKERLTYGSPEEGRSDNNQLRVSCYPAERSAFIQTLVSVFKKHAEKEDILTMMDKVKNLVNIDRKPEALTYKSTLSPEKLYFNPWQPFEEES